MLQEDKKAFILFFVNFYMGEKRGLRNFLWFLFILVIVVVLVNFTPSVSAWDKAGTTYNCTSCADCASAITDSGNGSTIQVMNSISNLSGACLNFGTRKNMTLDCLGNTITGGTGASGITINPGTTSNFSIIRNCNITGFGYGLYISQNSQNVIVFNSSFVSNYYGVGFSYAYNSTVLNSTFTSNTAYGIYVYFSNNITIINSSFNSNYQNGIYTSFSPYTTISKSTFNSNGNGSIQQGAIYIGSSANSTLSNNTIINNTYGIELSFSSNCTLKYNNLTNNQRNFYIVGFVLLDFIYDIDMNNTINNKPIYYWINQNNREINASSNPGYVVVINSTNITVRDLNMSYNGQGVLFINTSNSKIVNVTASYDYIGIQINPPGFNSGVLTLNNTIANNSVNYNDYSGIFVYHSDNTTLMNNSVNYNGLSSTGIATGVYLRWSKKIIMRNNTINNNKYNLLLLDSAYPLMDIDTGNKMDGKSVYYLINQANIEINSSHNPGFLALINSTNITVKDLNMSNNGENFLFEGLNNSRIYNITSITTLYTFLINNSHNNIFYNIYTKDCLQDILNFKYSTNNTLINISSLSSSTNVMSFEYSDKNKIYNSSFSSNNVGRGIYLQYTNNTLIDGVYTWNISYGLTIQYGYNNRIINSIFENNTDGSMNGKGIEINYADNNTFMNVTVNGSMACDYCGGVALYNANNNTFINLTSINNAYGISFWANSLYNVINNSRIENNSVYGLYFNEYSSSYPQYNLIYNNYIRNNINYYNNSALVNYFNTTKTLLSGTTNVIGGSYLGGNFWATLNNTGFSQLCTDADADGICDSVYNIDTVNYDYLPLYSLALVCIPTWTCTDWSTCSGGIQTRTCTDVYSCGVDTSKPAESQFCTSGGGGTSTTTTTVTTPSIPSGTPATITITNPNIEVGSVTISTNENVSSVSVTVTEVPKTKVGDFVIGVSAGGAGIYQALNITARGLNNSQIESASINFRVNISWVEQQRKATEEDIHLFRRNDITNKWEALNTTYLYNDSQFYYYTAITPGFSTFVIYFGRYECEPGIRRCFESQIQMCLGNATWLVTEKCTYGCEDGECISAPLSKFDLKILYFALGIIIIGLIVIFLSRHMPKGKNKSSKEVRSSLRHRQSFHRQG